MIPSIVITGASIAGVYVFPKSDAVHDGLPEGWNLKAFHLNDFHKHPNMVDRLSRAFALTLVGDAFIPNISADGRITDAERLADKILLNGATVHRSAAFQVDGLFLKHGQTFATSAGKCTVIVASGGEHFIAAHVANHKRAISGIINAFNERGVDSRDITFGIRFAPKELERMLVDEALESGVSGVYVADSLEEFPVLMDTGNDESGKNNCLIVVTRKS